LTQRRLNDRQVGVAQYEKYEDAAEQVYRILLKQSAAVQMLSCDEAFVDVSGLGEAEEIAATTRAQVCMYHTSCESLS
jgi:DNA repair protein REV1